MNNNLKGILITNAILLAAGMGSGFEPTQRRSKPKRKTHPHTEANKMNKARDRQLRRRAKRLDVRTK